MADPDITDTGPLGWAQEHIRAQTIASVVLVIALLGITGMLVFWAWWE